MPITNSTVESQCIIMKTPVGTILHTGDRKLDSQPLVGKRTSETRIKTIGQEGVLAVIGDATNTQIEGHSGSENDVRSNLRSLILKEKGRVVCTSFLVILIA